MDDLVVHADDLTSTNNAIGGAVIKVDEGGTDGSFINGNFSIIFGTSILTSRFVKKTWHCLI